MEKFESVVSEITRKTNAGKMKQKKENKFVYFRAFLFLLDSCFIYINIIYALEYYYQNYFLQITNT